MTRYTILSLSLALSSAAAVADAPDCYYDSCEGLCGRELLEALCQVTAEHDNVGYSGLWKVFATSDIRPSDGTIEDIYTTIHWEYGVEQCGNYSGIGDCYNREHSMPKSWFNSQEPMRSDAHHIFPTDGWVNNKRGNYPYGECEGGTTWSEGDIRALGRLGRSTFPGYSGIVFEPDDMYKGDLARAYFYMAACYNTLIDDWSSDMLAGNTYPAFTDWAVEMLLKWHTTDSVSAKEVRRNDAVYDWQRNRNPFVDYPELADHVWGRKKDVPWSRTPDASVSAVSEDNSVRWCATPSAGCLTLESVTGEPVEVAIYAPDGSLRLSIPAVSAPTAVSLPGGIYIVAGEGSAQRVRVM